MIRLVRSGNLSTNVDRYSRLIHQMLDEKDENAPGFRKLSLETHHVAKFICQLDDSIQIIQKREEPDFIIKHRNKTIGLEHEVLVNQDSKKKEGSLRDLFASIEKEYRTLHPEERFLLTIFPHPGLTFRKVDKPKIKRFLMKLIENFVISEQLPENEYIEDLTIMPHSRLDFHCNLGAWWQKDLDQDILIDAIHKKQQKISAYKENTGLSKQWLLIVIGTLDDSSYEIESLESFRNVKRAGFKRVFILEDFRANLYEVRKHCC